MSYNFDGKIVNQSPRVRFNSGNPQPTCEYCVKLIENPVNDVVKIAENSFFTWNYIGKSHFIYETKSGKAVVYCSEYCRNKHNHRFQRKNAIK